ncbi:MAG: CpaD family pilus assembly protein [Pseudomonadota bacterium]
MDVRDFPICVATSAGSKRSIGKPAIALAAALCLGACTGIHSQPKVAGWTLGHPNERHPITLSRQPAETTVRVSRGAYGLSPRQRAHVISFFRRYSSSHPRNTKLEIYAPSGGANEVGVQQTVAELRRIATDLGLDATRIIVRAHHVRHGTSAPVRLRYLRYVAEGPECGHNWPRNLAEVPDNQAYADFGCANQRNLAAMVANPADLEGPRAMTPRPSQRRDTTWEKFKKGDSTVATTAADEKVKTTAE